ncbi:MAG: putative pyridoxine 5'-phosphate oxidase superfamily flavin-nucleotide-binding protein [Lentimonas sp.]|jgi:predicted pyridoxine 5'-phosphate oxidase superfamily flavin-nucleotide-binding protein
MAGPKGFIQVLDAITLAMADFRGNNLLGIAALVCPIAQS